MRSTPARGAAPLWCALVLQLGTQRASAPALDWCGVGHWAVWGPPQGEVGRAWQPSATAAAVPEPRAEPAPRHAVAPTAQGRTGFENTLSQKASDAVKAARLYEISEQLVGLA